MNINNYMTGMSFVMPPEVYGSLKVARSARPPEDPVELKEACNKFEAVFVRIMLSEMKKTVKKSGFFGEDSFASETFTSMLDAEIADNVVKAGGIGIADQLYNSLRAGTGGYGLGTSLTPNP